MEKPTNKYPFDRKGARIEKKGWKGEVGAVYTVTYRNPGALYPTTTTVQVGPDGTVYSVPGYK